jgi:hypothetical protein
MNLELNNAEVHYVEENESGSEAYWVTAHDERFGDRIIVAEFAFDNTHGGGWYKARAAFMAKKCAEFINSQS